MPSQHCLHSNPVSAHVCSHIHIYIQSLNTPYCSYLYSCVSILISACLTFCPPSTHTYPSINIGGYKLEFLSPFKSRENILYHSRFPHLLWSCLSSISKWSLPWPLYLIQQALPTPFILVYFIPFIIHCSVLIHYAYRLSPNSYSLECKLYEGKNPCLGLLIYSGSQNTPGIQ